MPVLIEVVRKADNFFLTSTYTNPLDGTFVATGLPMDVELVVRASDDYPDLDGFAGECYDNTVVDWGVPIVLTSEYPGWGGVVINLDWAHDSATEEHLTFNVRSGRILEDVAIRQAIAYGTNRQALLENAFQPFGTTGEILNALVYPDSWFEAPASDPLLTVYNYAPVTASALLTSAGWVDVDADGIREKDGMELALDFKTTTAPVRMASGALFKSQMAAIGILIYDTYIPAGDFFSDDPATSPLLSGDFDIVQFAWVVEDFDYVMGIYSTGNVQNFGGYANATLDGYYNTAKAAKQVINNAAFEANALDWQYEYSADLPSFPLFTRLPMPLISGTIRFGSGAPFTGIPAELSLRDGLGTLLSTWTTNSLDGTFYIPVLPGFSGSIVPSAGGYVFNPVSRAFTNVTADIEGQDFTAIPYNLLTVSKTGTGSGTVTSLPSGISCGSECAEGFAPGTVVKLTATASPGSLFTGWSGGGCSGLKFCYAIMSVARSVTASFTTIPPGTFPLTVVKGGAGSGTATSTPAGISCGTDCWEFYTAGTAVRLSAAASPGSTFIGWSGACGSLDYCWLGMGASKYVTANFAVTPPGTFPLLVAMKGKGTGTVTSNVPGISCWPDCYEFYTSGQVVRLAAVAAPGSTFTGWSGGCGGTAYCWLTLSQARFVTANWVLNTASIPPLEADLALLRDPFAFFTFLIRPLEALLP
jgi:hypothetical protein